MAAPPLACLGLACSYFAKKNKRLLAVYEIAVQKSFIFFTGQLSWKTSFIFLTKPTGSRPVGFEMMNTWISYIWTWNDEINGRKKEDPRCCNLCMQLRKESIKNSGSKGSNSDLCDPPDTGAAFLGFLLCSCDFYGKYLPYTNGGRIPFLGFWNRFLLLN